MWRRSCPFCEFQSQKPGCNAIEEHPISHTQAVRTSWQEHDPISKVNGYWSIALEQCMIATHARRVTVLGRHNSDTWKTLLGEDIDYQGDTLRVWNGGQGKRTRTWEHTHEWCRMLAWNAALGDLKGLAWSKASMP
jgi:hypothetical protein